MKDIIIRLVILLILTSPVAAKTTHTFWIDQEKKILALPEGYCDLSDSSRGEFFYQRLATAASQNPNLPQPALVMFPCDGDPNKAYPWGYVTVPQAIAGMTQEQLNSKVLNACADTDYLQTLGDSLNKYENAAITLNNKVFNAKFDSLEVGVPVIAKVSQWAIHFVTKAAVVIAGKQTLEHMHLSQAIIDGHMYFFYMITEPVSQLPDTWFALVDEAIKQSQSH